MNYLGENIRILRKSKNLSIAELAKLSKASPASISLIENGKRDATFKLILSIAQALNVEVAKLVTPIKENNYKHYIQSLMSFSDNNHLIIGKSVNISRPEICWGLIFNLPEEILVDILYVQRDGNDFDFNTFFEEILKHYLIQQRLRILAWKCHEIDKTYLEAVADGINWDIFKGIIEQYHESLLSNN